jgi:hypothetical protein
VYCGVVEPFEQKMRFQAALGDLQNGDQERRWP